MLDRVEHRSGDVRFTNARIVTADACQTGDLTVRRGRIEALSAGPSPSEALDLDGDFLIPGLIDIHTDNLERHYQPRPGAHWDPLGAALAHDGQMAAAGITTVFDSLSLHGEKDGLDRTAALAPMIDGLARAAEENILRAQHFLHLRCEVTNPALMTTLNQLVDHPMLKLLSIMDHSPGQRQMRNMDSTLFESMMRKDGRSEEEIKQTVARWLGGQFQAAIKDNRASVFALAAERGLPLAAHDEETVDHVVESIAGGATIAEFPVTLEAAREARKRGMQVFMGAPNLVRGRSHSGNVSVAEIAQAGLLDGLASDYVPLSMLRAAFLLTEPAFGLAFADAIATVTLAPARAVGLVDRGQIAEGLRADLVRVGLSRDGWPIVRGVWREGQRVG